MIEPALTKSMLKSALADMRQYYSPGRLVIIMGNEAFIMAQKQGILDGTEGEGLYFHGVSVELSGEVPADMVYVASKE